MRYPDRLPAGGTIGFVAPSFGCATEPYISAFKNALKKFEADGYQTKLGPNCYASDGIGISSTPENCGIELTEGYCDSESDAIISCGGGELMCEILDFVDFDRISQAKPKWYMGYSDNTNFTFTLTTMCDVASIYGPCASSFGAEPRHRAISDAFSVMTNDSDHIHIRGYDKWELESIKDEENPLVGYNLTEDAKPLRFLPDGNPMILGSDACMTDRLVMDGRLIGGCLDCLVNLCGTKYDQVREFNKKYAAEGTIWFLEACDLNPMSIRRAMWELEHAGWFEGVSGFLIGRSRLYGDELMGLDNYKAYYDIISHYKVPVLMDIDLGHLPPAVPLVTGSVAHIESEGNGWNIEMNFK